MTDNWWLTTDNDWQLMTDIYDTFMKHSWHIHDTFMAMEKRQSDLKEPKMKEQVDNSLTISWQLVDNWSTIGQQLVNNWSTTGQQLVNNWLTIGWQLVDNWQLKMKTNYINLLALISCELGKQTGGYWVSDAFGCSFLSALDRSSEEISAGEADWGSSIQS